MLTRMRRMLITVPVLVATYAAFGCSRSVGAVSTSAVPADDVDVGYGLLPRARVTSPITSISPTPTERTAAGRIEELLIGRAPGVEVRRTATGGYSLRIRGAAADGEPLIVLDGTPQPPNLPGELILGGINPADVRRIEILRGSSAAVYGLRGGNGVIVIERRPRGD